MDNFEDEEVLRADCVRAFKQATKEGQARLSREDYKVAILELLGYKPSKYEVENVWEATGRGVAITEALEPETAGVAGDIWNVGGLSLDEFVSIMIYRLRGRDKDELVHEVFTALDVTQRGFLTEVECLAAFKQVAPSMKKDVVKALFMEVDSNGDGRLSYKDFELMMKSSLLKLKIPNELEQKSEK